LFALDGVRAGPLGRLAPRSQKVEFGWPIGRPHRAPLLSGLWEVRSTLAGNRIALIFCMDDGCMILLHGFVKKTQRTPQADIDLALKRKSGLSR
jgi:hypothetical protein